MWLLSGAMGLALTLGFIGLIVARDGVNSFALAFGFVTFPGWLWLWPMQPILPNILGAIVPPTFIGWLVYASLGLAAVAVSSRQTWKRLFVLFVILLGANVAGCWYGSFTYLE